MPAPLTYPGVYIQEVPSGVRTITGVATSITAFVGGAAAGPTDEPVMLTSFADYERRFGGLDVLSPMSYAVRDFYSNGGSLALIVRVPHDDASSATITLPGSGGADTNLVLEASSRGAWGNLAKDRRQDRGTLHHLVLAHDEIGPLTQSSLTSAVRAAAALRIT
jgi:hypothetical protein